MLVVVEVLRVEDKVTGLEVDEVAGLAVELEEEPVPGARVPE